MKNLKSKFVPFSLLIALLTTLAPPNQAQVPTTLTSVLCSPQGPEFTVDGATYVQPMSAFWPIGSKHTLAIPQGYGGLSYNSDQTIQFAFSGWSWTGVAGLSGSAATGSNSLSVTADPTIQQYLATFTILYKFGIKYFSCSDPVSCAASPGTIMMNGIPITSDNVSWQVPGSAIILQAFPNSGWIFNGWQTGPNQTIFGLNDNVTVNAPLTVYPIFVPAKNVNFATNPANMKLYADGVLLVTPTTLQWGEGTVHSIAALPEPKRQSLSALGFHFVE